MRTNHIRPSLSLLTTITGLALLSLTCSPALADKWTITDLGALGAEHSLIYASEGWDINNAGQVTGKGVVLINGSREAHYVPWSNGTQTDLGIPISSSAVNTAPINDTGQVCGWFALNIDVSGEQHAFIWQGGGGTPLPQGTGSASIAVAMNNHGHVVGSINPYSVNHSAALWRDGTLTILNNLPEVVAAGWHALTARDINDQNQIVGSGYHGEFVHAFLLSPIVVPPVTIARSGTDVVLSFGTQTGVSHQLQSSTSLLPASWLNVGVPYSGNGSIQSATITIGPESKKFFRLQLLDD